MTDFDVIMRNFAPEKEIFTRICACGNEFEYDHQHGATKTKCAECSAYEKKQRTKMNKQPTNPVLVVGHIPQQGVPQEDYSDYFTGQMFTFDEVKYMIYNGSFTPGIVLQREGTPKVIVVGEDENQELRVL